MPSPHGLKTHCTVQKPASFCHTFILPSHFLCRLDPAQLKNKLWLLLLKLIGDNTGVILLFFFLITVTCDWMPKSIFQVHWHLSGVKYFISLRGSGASAASAAVANVSHADPRQPTRPCPKALCPLFLPSGKTRAEPHTSHFSLRGGAPAGPPGPSLGQRRGSGGPEEPGKSFHTAAG